MPRACLPNRRLGSTFPISHGGFEYLVTVGRYADGRSIGEVFIEAIGKGGKNSPMSEIARDAAILISLALQHFTPLDTLRNAVSRNGNGAPATLIGAVLDSVGGNDAD